MNLALISTSSYSKENEQNLNKTIYNGVSIDDCFKKNLITETERNILYREFPKGYFTCWGTHDGLTFKHFDKLEKNDLLIGGKKTIANLKGKIAYVMNRPNSELGKFLWNSESWKWIFFIKDIKEIEEKLEIINTIIGYKANNRIQGFSVKENITQNAENYINKL